MKSQVPLKSALRRPVQLLLTVALAALAAFAFVSRAAEGLAVGGEINRLAGMYHSVGALEPSVDELYLKDLRIPREAVAMIEEHPGVDYVNAQRVVSGVMEDLYTPDIDGFSPYPNLLYLYGTLEGKTTGYLEVSESTVYFFSLRIDRTDASLPDYAAEPGTVLTLYIQDFDGSMQQVYDQAVLGERYYVKGQYGFIQGLLRSQRPPTDLETSRSLHLLVQPQPETGVYFLPAPPGSQVQTDAHRAEIEVLEQNARTVFLRTVKDMTALPQAGDTLLPVEGRLLNREDDLQGRRVCAIRREFADLRGLKLGDTISLTMRNLPAAIEYYPPESLVMPGRYRNEIYTPFGWITGFGVDNMHNLDMATGYITPADEGWREAEAKEETFEIVGIFDAAAASDRLMTVSWNDVYVPDSCVPAGWAQEPVYTGFSMVLTSPGREKDVLLDLRSRLDDMGYWLEFADTGWDRFAASVLPIRTSLGWGVAVFTALTLAVLVLLTEVYFRRQRQELAIMRALGMRRRAAAAGTALPLLLMGGAGVVIGSVPAWFYASRQAADTLAGIAGAELSPLPVGWLALLMGCLVLILGLLAGLRARALSRRPVLELLQGKRPGFVRAAAPVPKAVPAPAAPSAPARQLESAAAPTSPPPGRGGRGHILRFALKRTVRTPAKSLLAILLAGSFLLVLSWLPAAIKGNRETVDRLYDTTVITAEIIKDLSGVQGNVSSETGQVFRGNIRNIQGKVLRAILDTGYIGDYYTDAYEHMRVTALRDEPTGPIQSGFLSSFAVAGTSDLAGFEGHLNAPLTVEYAPGYGPEIFEKEEAGEELTALISREGMERIGARLGDYIALGNDNEQYAFYRLVGCYEFFSSFNILVPLADMHAHTRQNQYYNRGEFWLDPAGNRNLEPFQDEIREIFSQPMYPKLKFVLRDYILKDVVEPLERSIHLMEVLYPVALAVAALISAASCLLLVLQSMEDAAKMRVLGATRAQVCGALVFEQGLLCLVGLALAGAAALPLLGSVNRVALGVYLGCGLAAALAGSLAVIRKKPLELLQVKE